MARFLATFILVFGTFTIAFNQEKSDSLSYRNSVKLDLVPLYHVLFDNRVQIRAGLEYERSLSAKSSLACYLDIGLYDKYDFIKYYDFFSQSSGIYSAQQKVSIAGFHLLPSYNYCFYNFKKKQSEKLFAASVLDFGFYHKTVDHYNTLTAEGSSDNYDQTKLGIGLGLGFKNQYKNRFFIELKTSFFTKIYNFTTSGLNQIKSLDAQWTSPNYRFWWISNIKIGYAF